MSRTGRIQMNAPEGYEFEKTTISDASMLR